jgi:hypothetical protein
MQQERTLDDLLAEVYSAMNEKDVGMAKLENFIRQSMVFNILAETALKAKHRTDELCEEFCGELESRRLSLADRIARQTIEATNENDWPSVVRGRNVA